MYQSMFMDMAYCQNILPGEKSKLKKTMQYEFCSVDSMRNIALGERAIFTFYFISFFTAYNISFSIYYIHNFKMNRIKLKLSFSYINQNLS